MTNNDNKISVTLATEIWEDNVGDSGIAPTDVELRKFANSVIEMARPDIEKKAAVGAMPAELYNKLMNFLLEDVGYTREAIFLANDIKDLFGKSARKAAGLNE